LGPGRERERQRFHHLRSAGRVHVAFEGFDACAGHTLGSQPVVQADEVVGAEVHDVHALVAGQRDIEIVRSALLRGGRVPQAEIGVGQDLEVVVFEDRRPVAGPERLRRLAGLQDDPGQRQRREEEPELLVTADGLVHLVRDEADVMEQGGPCGQILAGR
jgi:hypothetical protein